MKKENVERARFVDKEYFGNISLEQSVDVLESALEIMKDELTQVNVRRKAGDMLFALIALARNQGWDLDELLKEATAKVESKQRERHYYEAHITIEPVFEERLKEFKEVSGKFDFRVAELLMRKRTEDVPERSSNDSFCTGRSISYSDIKTRMLNLVKNLRDSGFKVWRYKIESTLLDSRYDDSKLPLDRSKLPEKERTPRPPAGQVANK